MFLQYDVFCNVCEFCGKQFTRNSNINRYLRTHYQQKITCEKKFYWKDVLDKQQPFIYMKNFF